MPQRCVIDAEIVVRSGEPGSEERLQWETLSAEDPPRRVADPQAVQGDAAELVCFDLLALGEESLMGQPFRQRRAALEQALSDLKTVTRST